MLCVGGSLQIRCWASDESVSSSGGDRPRRRGRFFHPAVDLAAHVVQGALLSRRQAERALQTYQLRAGAAIRARSFAGTDGRPGNERAAKRQTLTLPAVA